MCLASQDDLLRFEHKINTALRNLTVIYVHQKIQHYDLNCTLAFEAHWLSICCTETPLVFFSSEPTPKQYGSTQIAQIVCVI